MLMSIALAAYALSAFTYVIIDPETHMTLELGSLLGICLLFAWWGWEQDAVDKRYRKECDSKGGGGEK